MLQTNYSAAQARCRPKSANILFEGETCRNLGQFEYTISSVIQELTVHTDTKCIFYFFNSQLVLTLPLTVTNMIFVL